MYQNRKPLQKESMVNQSHDSGVDSMNTNSSGMKKNVYLKLGQYKNGFISVKCMPVLKMPPFFLCRVGDGKRAAIMCFTEVSPFLYCFSPKLYYIVFRT